MNHSLLKAAVVSIFQVPEYLLHVEKRLEEESERLLHYLDQSTKYVFSVLNPALALFRLINEVLVYVFLNSLPSNKMLVWSKFKAFANNLIN